MPFQQQFLKMPTVMSLIHKFIWKLNAEAEEISKKLKNKHTHGNIVSMLANGYNKFTASCKFCCWR